MDVNAVGSLSLGAGNLMEFSPSCSLLTQVPHLGLYPRLNRHYLPERSTPDSVFFGKQEDENNPPPAVDRLNVAFHPTAKPVSFWFFSLENTCLLHCFPVKNHALMKRKKQINRHCKRVFFENFESSVFFEESILRLFSVF